jgi:hypothetical protein
MTGMSPVNRVIRKRRELNLLGTMRVKSMPCTVVTGPTRASPRPGHPLGWTVYLPLCAVLLLYHHAAFC